jgi:hypothetical protein
VSESCSITKPHDVRGRVKVAIQWMRLWSPPQNPRFFRLGGILKSSHEEILLALRLRPRTLSELANEAPGL